MNLLIHLVTNHDNLPGWKDSQISASSLLIIYTINAHAWKGLVIFTRLQKSLTPEQIIDH